MSDSLYNTEDKAGDNHIDHTDLFKARYYYPPVGW
jgi:hypothetical protein